LIQSSAVEKDEVILSTQQNGIDEDISTQELEKWTTCELAKIRILKEKGTVNKVNSHINQK
jgi:hypothetical protein